MNLRFVLLIIISIIFISCRKEFFGEDPKNTPVNNFEIFWNDFNKNYSQFEIRHINWDSVYLVYKPQITSNTDNIQLYNILSKLVYTINDMHVNLFTPYGTASWKSKAFGSYPSSKFINLCQYIICDNNQKSPIFEYRSFRGFNIGYIIIYTFEGEGSGLSNIDNRYNLIDNILEQFKYKQGIVIDVRSNGGGELFNALTVASRFADEKRLFGKVCFKNGLGKNDFSDWQNQYVEPSGTYQYKKPIVVITSRATSSAAEQFVLAMKTFPYVTIVGDTTGGGMGLPMYRELPNGWSYRLSTSIGADPDNHIIEGRGVIPDFPVQTSVVDSIKGIDRLIEKSIEVITMKINK